MLVLTGAGISAESGIPTFRGKEGYWRNLDPTKLATAEPFERDPDTVWQWYRERRARVHAALPNPAHEALVKLAAHSADFLLLTQNVDDLHGRAEWEGRRLPAGPIVQVHGDLFGTACSRCDFSRQETDEDAQGVPMCPICGAPMRPGVVWFDEELDPRNVERVERYIAQPCDVVLVVGTTAAFDYIVRWARVAAGTAGRIIEINPDQTGFSRFATTVVRDRAAVALPGIVDALIS